MTQAPIRNYIEPFAFSAAVLLRRWPTAWGEPLKAPFPVFGGKSRVAAEVWSRFGAGESMDGMIETINDRNAYVPNFWRAVNADPERVAYYADSPVFEADLHARHAWLVASDRATAALQRVREDPDYFDAQIAGWWAWGACCWIGSGWCDETHRNSSSKTRPDIEGQMVTASKTPMIGDRTSFGRGLVCGSTMRQQIPDISGDSGATVRGVCASAGPKRDPMRTHLFRSRGIHAKVPNDRQPALAQDEWGVNAGAAGQSKRHRLAQFSQPGTGLLADHRPQLADQFSRGRGVNGHDALTRCAERREWVTRWMLRLQDRLRSVRVCCGHWSRVCDSPSTMTRLGITGVFLDPPYRTELSDGTANRSKHIYANDRHQNVNALCDEVQAWCLKWGKDPMVRIALCGLEGEYPEIEREGSGWDVYAWKSNGGYGNRKGGAANVNAARERIWFSPHCLRPEREEAGLFNSAANEGAKA